MLAGVGVLVIVIPVNLASSAKAEKVLDAQLKVSLEVSENGGSSITITELETFKYLFNYLEIWLILDYSH